MIEYLISIHLGKLNFDHFYEDEVGRHTPQILDVGPGYSNWSRIAAQATGATRITFLDIEPSVLSWQYNECLKIGIQADSLHLDLSINSLSCLTRKYTLILCMEVLEHLANAEEVLHALVNCLAPHGYILITVPTKISERWLKLINPSYMVNEAYGHVRQFDDNALKHMLKIAGLSPVVLIPTQPHYFLSHTWLFGTRMKVEGSTGKILTKGIRTIVFHKITNYSKRFFMMTDPAWWGRRFPRNYFVIATKGR